MSRRAARRLRPPRSLEPERDRGGLEGKRRSRDALPEMKAHAESRVVRSWALLRRSWGSPAAVVLVVDILEKFCLLKNQRKTKTAPHLNLLKPRKAVARVGPYRLQARCKKYATRVAPPPQDFTLTSPHTPHIVAVAKYNPENERVSSVTPVYTPDYDLRRETVSVMLLEQEEIASVALRVGCDVCAQINSPQALGGRVQTPLGRPGCDISTLGGGVRTPPAKRHPYFIGGGQRHPHSRTRIALKSRRNRLKIPLVG